METSAIKDQVKGIISQNTQLKVEQIGDDAELHGTLGIDSLTLLEIALSIDQEFETDFSEEELLQMHTVNKAVEMVSGRISVNS